MEHYRPQARPLNPNSSNGPTPEARDLHRGSLAGSFEGLGFIRFGVWG